LSHPFPKYLPSHHLRVAAREDHTPESVDLIFNALGMLDELGRVLAESFLFILGVLFLLVGVSGEGDEPNTLKASISIDKRGCE